MTQCFCEYVLCDVRVLCSVSVSGAFLLYSQKKLAKLKETEQTPEANVNGRNAAVLQVLMHRSDDQSATLCLCLCLEHRVTFTVLPPQLLQQWQSLDEAGTSKYRKKSSRCPEPSLSSLRPDVCFGSVSENFHSITEKYLDSRDGASQETLDTDRYPTLESSHGQKTQLKSTYYDSYWDFVILENLSVENNIRKLPQLVFDLS